MLRHLPDKASPPQSIHPHVQHLLRLFLKPQETKAAAKGNDRQRDNSWRVAERDTTANIEAPDNDDTNLWEVDYFLVWVWQAPVMLMNYSWVSFLVGYEAYILTPVIFPGESGWTAAKVVSVNLPRTNISSVQH